MKVSNILDKKGKKIFTINENLSVLDAVKILSDNKIGSLIVINDNNDLEGIVSERDVLYKCYAQNMQICDKPVKEIMTPKNDLIIGKIDDTPTYLMNVMTSKRIRHIPILDKDTIVGIVSIGDVLKNVLESSEIEAKLLKEHIQNPFGVHIYKQK
ncbi:MAG: inosine-5-monophosphate dehydrogenase [Bacteroidetes bacterium]|nr:MAG: inosine-5-monophosphate dehydrogenase [Bacteroidota bacterium]